MEGNLDYDPAKDSENGVRKELMNTLKSIEEFQSASGGTRGKYMPVVATFDDNFDADALRSKLGTSKWSVGGVGGVYNTRITLSHRDH